jgi:hypothetical protein
MEDIVIEIKAGICGKLFQHVPGRSPGADRPVLILQRRFKDFNVMAALCQQASKVTACNTRARNSYTQGPDEYLLAGLLIILV